MSIISKKEELRFRWKWIGEFLKRATDVHKHIADEIVQDLLELRVDTKMSREKCAGLMGITAGYLYLIEQGKVPINETILEGYLGAVSGVRSDVRVTKRRGRQIA